MIRAPTLHSFPLYLTPWYFRYLYFERVTQIFFGNQFDEKDLNSGKKLLSGISQIQKEGKISKIIRKEISFVGQFIKGQSFIHMTDEKKVMSHLIHNNYKLLSVLPEAKIEKQWHKSQLEASH